MSDSVPQTDLDGQALWQGIAEIFARSRKNWFLANFGGVKVKYDGGDALTVYIPDEQRFGSLNGRANRLIEQAAKTISGRVINVSLELKEPVPQASNGQAAKGSSAEKDVLQIRDARGSKRYFIDNVFLRGGWGAAVGPYGIAIYDAIALHADGESQDGWPSYSTLAKITGMSRLF